MIRRELHGNLLLALFSLKRNFNIYISDTATFKYLLGKNLINPGILHTKSITHGEAKSKFHQQLIDKNFKITAIDEEHGLLDNYDYNEYYKNCCNDIRNDNYDNDYIDDYDNKCSTSYEQSSFQMAAFSRASRAKIFIFPLIFSSIFLHIWRLRVPNEFCHIRFHQFASFSSSESQKDAFFTLIPLGGNS